MAITNAQQYKQLMQNGGRIGLRGGGMDASTKSFDASANPDRKGGPIGREDRQSMVGKPASQGGITQFQADNQGFTPTQIENQNVGNLDGDDYYTAKKEFEESVDRRKLKRPEDDFFGPREDYPGSLYYTGVPKSNIPYLGTYLNMAAPFRNKILEKNIDYFTGLSQTKYPQTVQGYKDYMADRLAGKITATGNTV